MSVDTFLLSADTTDLNYPEIRPTLDLNFARTKTLDPRITFTRSSGGSYVGPDGLIKLAGVNEARFDHDPSTGESLGLLIEEARTNLVTNNNTFTLASNSTITIDNSITSPDGTTGVQKVNSNITVGTIYSASNNIANSSGSAQNYTWSVFIKKGNPLTSSISIQFGVTNTAALVYNFNTDIITNFSAVSFGRTLYPNGWVRLYGMTSIPNGSTFNLIVIVGSVENSGGIYANFYQWGAQIEQASFPTSYIPTVASTRTRAADNASITGKNFSDFYNQIDSALFFSGRTIESTSARLFGGIVDTTKGFVSSIYFNTGGSPAIVAWSPIGGGAGDLGRYVQNTLVKGILTYTSSQPTASWCRDGGTVGSIFNRSFSFGGVTQFGFPNTMNRLVIGSSPWGFDAILNGTVSRVTYWPKRLPNAQLQALTR